MARLSAITCQIKIFILAHLNDETAVLTQHEVYARYNKRIKEQILSPSNEQTCAHEQEPREVQRAAL